MLRSKLLEKSFNAVPLLAFWSLINRQFVVLKGQRGSLRAIKCYAPYAFDAF